MSGPEAPPKPPLENDMPTPVPSLPAARAGTQSSFAAPDIAPAPNIVAVNAEAFATPIPPDAVIDPSTIILTVPFVPAGTVIALVELLEFVTATPFCMSIVFL